MRSRRGAARGCAGCPPPRRQLDCVGRRRCRAHAQSDVRSRGLTRIVARSASRLRTTYSPAIRSASACTSGHVACADRVDQQEADAGVVEHRLDDDDAAGEVREVEGGDLEGRRERVRHRVAPQHAAFGEALEPRHLDEVALEDLDRRCSHDPSRVRDDGDHERDHRKDQLLRVVPRAGRRAR